MRAFRLLVIALCAALVSMLAPPVNAADDAPTAATYAIVDPDESGIARVIVLCTGQGPVADSASIKIECDLYDDSGSPSLHNEIFLPGPAGACILNGYGVKMPAEYCTTVTVTYRDLSQQSTSQCGHAGGAHPPHNPPAPNPMKLQCLDPYGTGI